jgi:hypothetical protein
MKTQILSLQQEIQRFKVAIKKVETEKEMQRISFQNELQQLREEMQDLKTQNEAMRQENEGLQEELEN